MLPFLVAGAIIAADQVISRSRQQQNDSEFEIRHKPTGQVIKADSGRDVQSFGKGVADAEGDSDE